MACKLYYDHYGPNRIVWSRAAKADPRMTNSHSFASEVKADVIDFLSGSTPPFQLIPARTHRAEHILLDCKFPIGADNDDGNGGSVVDYVSEALEAALEGAGLAVRQRQYQAFPSFKRSDGAAIDTAVDKEAGERPDFFFFAFEDGYASGVWFHGSNTLSVDLLGAETGATEAAREAARAFCDAVTRDKIGTKIAASVVKRLPI
jgi:hypothetical protein